MADTISGTISQLEINGSTYNIADASTRDTVSSLGTRVTILENSVNCENNGKLKIYCQQNSLKNYLVMGATVDTNNTENSERSELYISNRLQTSGKRNLIFDSNFNGSWFSVVFPEGFKIDKTTFSSISLSAGQSTKIKDLPNNCIMMGFQLSGAGYAACSLTQGDNTAIWIRNNSTSAINISGTIYYATLSGV